MYEVGVEIPEFSSMSLSVSPSLSMAAPLLLLWSRIAPIPAVKQRREKESK